MRPFPEILSDKRISTLAFDGDGCAFRIRLRDKRFTVVASVGLGWDHVSISSPARTPNWREMEAIKRLCFRDDEVAMQLHVPPSDHINVHPNCLHLWRPQNVAIPMPPSIMV